MKYLATSIFISTLIFVVIIGIMKIVYFATLAIDVAIKRHLCLGIGIGLAIIFILATIIRYYLLDNDKITNYYK